MEASKPQNRKVTVTYNANGQSGDSQPEIAVLKIQPVAGKGNLRGFASVKVGDITINDWRIVQQPGQRAWSSPPARSYTARDGAEKWAPIVEMPRDLKDRVNDAVLAAFADLEAPAPKTTEPPTGQEGSDDAIPF